MVKFERRQKSDIFTDHCRILKRFSSDNALQQPAISVIVMFIPHIDIYLYDIFHIYKHQYVFLI